MTENIVEAQTPEAAIAEINSLKADKEFGSAYLDPYSPRHRVANERMSNLHRVAYPEGAPAAQSANVPAQALEKISTLKRDPDFSRRLANGDHDANKEFTELHKQAYPDEPAEQPDGKSFADGAQPLDLKFDPDTTPEEAHEMQVLARDTVNTLGLDETTAQSGIRILQDAMVQREFRHMDAEELGKMESILQQRWGENYDAQVDNAIAHLNRTDPRGRSWLIQTMRAAGPETAAYALQLLASLPAKDARQ